MHQRQIAVRLPEELLTAIDEARGRVPRERWIRDALRAEVGRVPSPVRRPVTGFLAGRQEALNKAKEKAS